MVRYVRYLHNKNEKTREEKSRISTTQATIKRYHKDCYHHHLPYLCSIMSHPSEDDKTNITNILDQHNSRFHNQDVLLDQAQDHYENGYSFYRNKRYDESVQEYKKALWIRECIIGRYHDDTAFVYHQLGYAYFNKQDYPKSLIALGTWLRIQRYFSSSVCIPDISCFLIKKVLEAQGYGTDQIRLYDQNLMASLHHEKEGDKLRAKGEYKAAIRQYKQTIAVEMMMNSSSGLVVGNNTATVAYCWRKIALLSSVYTNDSGESMYCMDWNKVDRINTKWDKKDFCGTKGPNSEQILKAFRNGDRCYIDFNHREAIMEYQRLTNILLNKVKATTVVSPETTTGNKTSGFAIPSVQDKYYEQCDQFMQPPPHHYQQQQHHRATQILYNPTNSDDSNSNHGNRLHSEEDIYHQHSHSSTFTTNTCDMNGLFTENSIACKETLACVKDIYTTVQNLSGSINAAAEESFILEGHQQSLIKLVDEMKRQTDQFQQTLLAEVKDIRAVMSHQFSLLKQLQMSSSISSSSDVASISASKTSATTTTVVIEEGTGGGFGYSSPHRQHLNELNHSHQENTLSKRKRVL